MNDESDTQGVNPPRPAEAAVVAPEPSTEAPANPTVGLFNWLSTDSTSLSWNPSSDADADAARSRYAQRLAERRARDHAGRANRPIPLPRKRSRSLTAMSSSQLAALHRMSMLTNSARSSAVSMSRSRAIEPATPLTPSSATHQWANTEEGPILDAESAETVETATVETAAATVDSDEDNSVRLSATDLFNYELDDSTDSETARAALSSLPMVRQGARREPTDRSSRRDFALDLPLASASTPVYLQNFKFSHNGVESMFHESSRDSTVAVSVKRRPTSRADLSRPEKRRHTQPPNTDEAALSDGPDSPVSTHTENKPQESSEEADESAVDFMVLHDIYDHGSPHMSLPSPSASPVESEAEEEVVGDSESLALVPTANKEVSYPASGVITIDAEPPFARDSLAEIPNLVSSFEGLSENLKRYVLYNMLKRCNRTSLSMMSGIIVPALRSDIVGRLPSELGYNIFGRLDFQSLSRASQVSKHWNRMVDKSDWLWRSLLERDQYGVSEKEYSRAVLHRWDYTSWNEGPSTEPTSRSVNVYKAIYRRKHLIQKNWLDPDSQPVHYTIDNHSRDVVTCLQFDEERIITGSDDHSISVYSTKTGELIHRFRGHDGGVWALKYIHPKTIVSGSTDRTVRVWDIERRVCTHILYGHTSTVRCLDVLMPVDTFNPASGEIEKMPPMPLIVTGSRDATLRVWELPEDSNATAQDMPDPYDHDMYLLRTLRGHTSSVRAVSGYGDTVVSGSYDTTVRVWKISTGECVWELDGHAQRVYSAVLDHKRNRCISGSMDWLVKVWCLETGTLLYTLEGHTSLVGLVDLNRTTLVSAAADSTLRVWDPETGTLLHRLSGHRGPITCFQHDENKVVSGSEKSLKLWNIHSGKLIRNLLDNISGIWQVCFDDTRCIAAVKRGEQTILEVYNFDYDPTVAR